MRPQRVSAFLMYLLETNTCGDVLKHRPPAALGLVVENRAQVIGRGAPRVAVKRTVERTVMRTAMSNGTCATFFGAGLS